MAKYKVYQCGFLTQDADENMTFSEEPDGCPNEIIAESIAGELVNSSPSKKHPDDDDCNTHSSAFIPKASVKIYFTENKSTLEEAKEKQILFSLGELDIYMEWYGYSEFTILGFFVEQFQIGNHDLESILRSHKGKYCHFELEVLEN